jgi:hypothetical protein
MWLYAVSCYHACLAGRQAGFHDTSHLPDVPLVFAALQSWKREFRMYDHVPRRVRFVDLCDALARKGGIDELLPRDVVESLAGAPAPLVLADFAGRDSVAAAMAWLSEHDVATLIPVADVVPTRYGDWSVYDDNWTRMRDHVTRTFPGVRVTPWFCLEDVEFWRMLNARFLNELSRAFGFFTPCLGCHLHFYAMRAVLAEALGATVLISGEKELHHGARRKANQTVEAVDAYRNFSKAHGLEHRFPIYRVQTEAKMTQLLGDDWKEGDRQLRCVMSKNDTGVGGRPLFEPDQIVSYMERFASPLAARLVELRRAGVSGPRFSAAAEEYARKLLEADKP